MPAANRPRRSSRIKQSPKEEIDTSHTEKGGKPSLAVPKKKQKKITTGKKERMIEESDNDHLGDDIDDDGINDGLNDTDSSDDDDDVKSKPWMLKKQKPKKTQTFQSENGKSTDADKSQPIIPKRKKRDRDANGDSTSKDVVNIPSIPIHKKQKNKAEKSDLSMKIYDKSLEDANSLISNMAPVNHRKRQPAIRDWKSNADYKAIRQGNTNGTTNTKGSNVKSISKSSDLKIDPHTSTARIGSNNPTDKINKINPNLMGIELGDKIRKQLNNLIFKVLDSATVNTSANSEVNKSKTSFLVEDVNTMGRLDDFGKNGREKGKPSDSIDWNGSFLPRTSSQDEYDFGEFDETPVVPMFPEDFSSKRKEWPLSWWGIVAPSNELLDMRGDGNVGLRSKRRERDRDKDRDRDRDRSRDRHRDRDRDREKDRGRGSRNRDGDNDHGWRDVRRGGPMGSGGDFIGGGGQPYRGDGQYNDYRGPPPGDGHYPPYGPPHPGRGGGWQDQRMHDDGWRANDGGGGRGFVPGPGPNRGSYGPGLGPGGPGYGGRSGPQPFPRRI